MSNKLYVRAELGNIERILARRGLDKRGEVQSYIDNAVISLCDPYVPFLNGTLKESSKTFSPPGDGVVVYNTPYARRHYYEAMTNYSHQNGLRGRQWFERMKNDRLDDILAGAKKVAGVK